MNPILNSGEQKMAVSNPGDIIARSNTCSVINLTDFQYMNQFR